MGEIQGEAVLAVGHLVAPQQRLVRAERFQVGVERSEGALERRLERGAQRGHPRLALVHHAQRRRHDAWLGRGLGLGLG